jgi:hypothetical protein
MNADHTEPLHIFVNRKKFETGDGVKPEMTGAEIASLVKAPPDNSIVRYATGPHKDDEIGAQQPIQVKVGDHFTVTRRTVDGGHDQ